MAVEDDQLRLELLEDFGDSNSTFTDVSAGSSSTITAMLQTDYLLEETGGEIGVETKTPIITARSSDLPNVAQGDTVTIDSVVYTVVEVRDDGTGMTKLRARI